MHDDPQSYRKWIPSAFIAQVQLRAPRQSLPNTNTYCSGCEGQKRKLSATCASGCQYLQALPRFVVFFLRARGATACLQRPAPHRPMDPRCPAPAVVQGRNWSACSLKPWRHTASCFQLLHSGRLAGVGSSHAACSDGAAPHVAHFLSAATALRPACRSRFSACRLEQSHCGGRRGHVAGS